MDPRLEAAFDAELFARAAHLFGRRKWQAEVHIGYPTRHRTSLAVPDPIIFDLVVRAIEVAPPLPLLTAWMSRRPELDALDEVVAAAVNRAFASHRLEQPHFVIMDHDQWADQTTGLRKSWYRVRPERRNLRRVPALDPNEPVDPLAWLWE